MKISVNFPHRTMHLSKRSFYNFKTAQHKRTQIHASEKLNRTRKLRDIFKARQFFTILTCGADKSNGLKSKELKQFDQ